MTNKAKKYIDKRDREHTIKDILISFGGAFLIAIAIYPKETEEILKYFGLIPPIATFAVAFAGIIIRRYYSSQVLETNTTTTTATLEVTEPMKDLSPSNDTNATDTPTVSQ